MGSVPIFLGGKKEIDPRRRTGTAFSPPGCFIYASAGGPSAASGAVGAQPCPGGFFPLGLCTGEGQVGGGSCFERKENTV